MFYLVQGKDFMLTLSDHQYDRLICDAEVVLMNRFGPKVMQLENGFYLKVFHAKKWFSSDTFYPYSKRFYDNATELERLGISTIKVVDVFSIPHLLGSAVIYEPLVGEVLRSEKVKLEQTVAHKMGRFVGLLHHKGIYFRSLHLGNIVLTPHGELGLIDVADMRFYYKSLSMWQRKRNFHHLFRCPEDVRSIRPVLNSLINGYQSIDQGENIFKSIFPNLMQLDISRVLWKHCGV